MTLLNKIIVHPILPLRRGVFLPCIYREHIRFFSSDESKSNFSPSGGNPGEPTLYDTRKYGHQLPVDGVCPCFELLDGIPSGVFRCTTGEMLGLGAMKCGCYQNPEYFSYHHMSWFDFHLHLRKYRLVSPDTRRKPP